jgi:hypothetical protein
MSNYFVTERLGQERMAEALREAHHSRLARLAEENRERSLERRQPERKVVPNAAGAREVPSL